METSKIRENELPDLLELYTRLREVDSPLPDVAAIGATLRFYETAGFSRSARQAFVARQTNP